MFEQPLKGCCRRQGGVLYGESVWFRKPPAWPDADEERDPRPPDSRWENEDR